MKRLIILSIFLIGFSGCGVIGREAIITNIGVSEKYPDVCYANLVLRSGEEVTTEAMTKGECAEFKQGELVWFHHTELPNTGRIEKH